MVAIPQSGLLSQVSSLRLPSGHSVLVLTLSNVARASLFSPHLLVADASIWATSLRVAIRHVIYGLYYYFFLFFLPVMLPSEIPKLPTGPLVRGFLMFGNFSSFMTPSPGQISIPNSFVSLFVFYILSYLLSKTMGCLSGCLVSSARVQKWFCRICSAFKCSFDIFVGEKVVFPSYSSAILGPPLSVFLISKSMG